MKVELPERGKSGRRTRVKHGTITAYKNYDCRCGPCGLATSKHYTKNRPARGPRVPQHGKLQEYHKYKCRCEPCRAVKAVSNRKHKAVREARKQ